MRLEKCWFCSSTIYPGHGVAFVRNDCKVFRFCRSKCHKNFKLKRNPRKCKWTKAYRRSHGKEMATDSTFEFERKRNVPVKYDQELMQKTLEAMEKVKGVRKKREERFYSSRMRVKKLKEKQDALLEIKKNIDLIRTPSLKQKVQINVISAEKQKKEEAKNEEMAD